MNRYYNIQINTKVSNFTDGINLLCNEIRKLHSWERRNTITELLVEGFSSTKIAKILGVSRQSIGQQLKNQELRKVKDAK